MEWTSVTSSNLDAVAVDGNDLLVRFSHGGIYRYTGAASHFDALTTAESPGRYLNQNIKPYYPATKE